MSTPNIIVTIIMLAVTAGCRISGPQLDESELRTMEKRISDAIGDAPAGDLSACRTMAFGSKPCGGPRTYLIYSTDYTDEAQLAALVDSYNRLDDRINREQGLSSDCSIEVEPAIELRGGFCQPAP